MSPLQSAAQQAYAFFHQKEKVYRFSASFLREHVSFPEDLRKALEKLEKMIIFAG